MATALSFPHWRGKIRPLEWKSSPWPWVLSILLGIVLTLWVLLPTLATWYVNRSLAEMKYYDGHVQAVSFPSFFRGSFVAEQIEIHKKHEGTQIPFLVTPWLTVRIAWSELFRGRLVSDLHIHQPHLTLTDVGQEGPYQVEADWRRKIRSLFPIRIRSLTIQQGEVEFLARRPGAGFSLSVRDIDVQIKNITNRPAANTEYPTSVFVHGRTPGEGELEINAAVNPLTKPLPSFRLKFKIQQMNLVALNPIFRTYADFDVQKGNFDFYFEMDSTPTHYRGYAKPLLTDVDILDWEKDSKRKNFFGLLWEALVGTAATLFKNQPKDRLATVTPFSGTWKETDVEIWDTLFNLLRNAFFQALRPGFDRESKVLGNFPKK